MPRISCIITPTWNNEEYTIRCFNSIKKNTKNYKIIWIDNGSSSESRQKVKKFLDDKKVPYELIANEENLGFIKATNQGMKRAMELGAEYVVLQNNDTEVYEGWLERMIEVAESDQMIGLIGPITSPCVSWQSIVNLDINEFSDLPEYNNNPREYANIIKKKYKGKIVSVREYLAFFSVLIKKEVLENIGFLSEDYGVGLGDDNDYCARAINNGWKLVLAKDVFVFHNHRTTFKNIYTEEEIREMQKNAQKIYDGKFKENMETTMEKSIVDNKYFNKCPYCGKTENDKNHIAECEKNAPLISVIIPSRVGEKIISIEYLEKQNYKNIEIIVEYDEKQEGASVVRNRGIEKSKGEFLFFCDNDLELSYSCISDLYLCLKGNPDADWSFGKFYIDGKIFNENKTSLIPEKGTADWISYFEGMSTMSLVRADIKPKFDESMKKYNDWDLWLTLNAKGYKPVFCDTVLFSTKNRKGGISYPNLERQIEWSNKLYAKHNVFVFREFDIKNEMLNQKEAEIQNKKAEIQQKERELYDIRSSLRWKIPNYFYKKYLRFVKPIIPETFFRTKEAVFLRGNLLIARIRNIFLTLKNFIKNKIPQRATFTIGIASYNHSRYLEQCIESALAQDYKWFDVVIVDDNSSDPKNREILKKYEKNPKVKIIYKKENEGISASLNDQVLNASGNWVAFLDCDDYLPKYALSRMAKYLRAFPQKKLVFSNRIEIDENGNNPKNVWFGMRMKNPDIFEELLKGMVSSHLKIIHKDMFRRIGLFDPRFGGTHDYDIFLRAAFYEPKKFGYVDEYLYYHRIHSSQNTTVDNDRHKKNVEKILQEAKFRKLLYSGKFNKKVSIVILSFNRFEQLKNTVENIIKRAKHIKYNILIWDNASSCEKVISYLRSIDGKNDIRVVFSEENIKAAMGRKEATKLVDGDYILYFDNDIEIQKNLLEEMIIRIEESNEIASCCARIIFPDNKIQYIGGVINRSMDNFIEFSLDANGLDKDNLYTMLKKDYDWLGTGATMTKRKYAQLAEFDSGFINAFEDNDYYMQLVKAGLRLVHAPLASVIHHHVSYDLNRDNGTKKYIKVRHNEQSFIDSWVHFYKKWNLVVKDAYILQLAGLENKSNQDILNYLDRK